MTGFLLRKFFYDLWDNIFKTILINIVFLFIVAAALTLPPFLSFVPAAGAALFVILVYAAFAYAAAASSALKHPSDYRSFGFAEFAAGFKTAFFTGAFVLAAFLVVFCLLRFAFPFYILTGGWTGVAFAALSFWAALFFASAFQFYPAVRARLEKRPLKAVKKCLLIFIDNPLFCFGCLFFSILLSLLVISFPSWPLLFLDEALRLRLLKYDWLETQEPSQTRRRIPWKEILAEEREKTGKRTWHDFVFPWRE
jgi:hypothetical protein